MIVYRFDKSKLGSVRLLLIKKDR